MYIHDVLLFLLSLVAFGFNSIRKALVFDCSFPAAHTVLSLPLSQSLVAKDEMKSVREKR